MAKVFVPVTVMGINRTAASPSWIQNLNVNRISNIQNYSNQSSGLYYNKGVNGVVTYSNPNSRSLGKVIYYTNEAASTITNNANT